MEKISDKEKFLVGSVNPSSPKGAATTLQTVFTLVLKIAQPRGKIAPGTFKFIFSLHFSEKNFEPTTYPGGRVSFQSLEVGGGLVRSRDF